MPCRVPPCCYLFCSSAPCHASKTASDEFCSKIFYFWRNSTISIFQSTFCFLCFRAIHWTPTVWRGLGPYTVTMRQWDSCPTARACSGHGIQVIKRILPFAEISNADSFFRAAIQPVVGERNWQLQNHFHSPSVLAFRFSGLWQWADIWQEVPCQTDLKVVDRDGFTEEGGI